MIEMTRNQLHATLAGACAVIAALSLGGTAFADTAPSSPAPAPAPTATPLPALQYGAAFTESSFNTTGQNAVGALDVTSGLEPASRSAISNMLVTPTLNLGDFHASATVGYYNLPTVGYALNPTEQNGANTNLFSAVPLYDIAYTPNSHLTFSAGKLLTQLGQESMFTYQNFNIQRGFGWAIEPLVSRGVRGAYANGPWTLQLEENDGYYGGGTSRAFESSLAYAATGTQTFSFAVIDPRSTDAPNPTTAIANKREYDLMYAGTFGKFVLTPYLLWIQSPSAASLGYHAESATAGSLLGTYNFTPQYSLGFRYESIRNASATTDPAANADLLGYGPGSSATSYTLTPTLKSSWYDVRFELSSVQVTNLKSGLGFTAGGMGTHQDRFGLEFGLLH